MPKIPRLIAERAPTGRPATAVDFGADLAQGLAGLGAAVGEVGDVANALFKADQSAKESRAVARAAKEMGEFAFELEGDPLNYLEREQKFAAGREEILNRNREGLFGAGSQGEFDRRIGNFSDRSLMKVREGVRAHTLSAIAANTDLAVEDDIQGALASISDAERQDYLDAISESLQVAQDRGAFTPEQVARRKIAVEARLRDGDERARAQTITEELMAKHDSHAEREKEARETLVGKMQDDVIARLRDRRDEQNTRQAAAETQTFGEYVSRAIEGGIPREDVARLPGINAAQRQVIKTLVEQVATTGSPGLDGGTDFVKEGGSEFHTLLRENEFDPYTFRRRDLNLIRHLVTPDEWEQLNKEQLKDVPFAKQRYIDKVDEALLSLKLPTTKAAAQRNKKRGARAARFRDRVHTEKLRREREKEVPLAPEQIDEVIRFGLAEIEIVRPFALDITVARFAFLPEEVTSVPSDIRLQIIDLAVTQGRAVPTDEDLLAIYQIGLESGEFGNP